MRSARSILCCVPALLLTLTGCITGADTDSSSPTPPEAPQSRAASAEAAAEVEEALKKSTAVGTAKVMMVVEVRANDVSRLTTYGFGTVDLKRRRAEMGLQTHTGGKASQQRTIIIGDTVHTKKQGDFVWVDRTDKPLAGAPSVNPQAALNVVRSVQAWTDAGTIDVGGVSAKRYTGSVPFDRLLELAPASERHRVAEVQASGGSEIEVEVAVDDQQRLMRLATKSLGRTVTRSVTYDFSEWGTDVSIEPPKEFSMDLPSISP